MLLDAPQQRTINNERVPLGFYPAKAPHPFIRFKQGPTFVLVHISALLTVLIG